MRRPEAARGADPGLVAVELDAHHLALREAGERRHRQRAPVAPDEHDAHLDPRAPAVRRLHDRRVVHLAHEERARALALRDGGEVLRRHVHLHARAREGEERLQDPAVEVVGDVVEVAEQARLGHERVLQPGQGVLAPAEEPVRVARPLHVELLREAEGQLDLLLDELVHDQAVVDAQDARLLPVPLVPQLAAALRHVGRADGADPEELLRGREVRVGALPRRVEVEEDDVLGGKAAQDRVPHHAPVAHVVEAAQEELERLPVPGHHLEAQPPLEELEGVERGEALQLDEPGREPAVHLDDREVRLGEERVVVARRDVELRGHRRLRALERRGLQELVPDLERPLHHRVAQVGRQEDRRLADAEADPGPGRLGQALLVGLVGALGPGRVEGASQRLDHGVLTPLRRAAGRSRCPCRPRG